MKKKEEKKKTFDSERFWRDSEKRADTKMKRYINATVAVVRSELVEQSKISLEQHKQEHDLSLKKIRLENVKYRSDAKKDMDHYVKAASEQFRDQVKGVTEQFTSLNTRLDDLKETVGEMKVDITGLRLDVNELKDDVSTLKTDMVDVKEDVSEIREDMSDIKEELKTKQPV